MRLSDQRRFRAGFQERGENRERFANLMESRSIWPPGPVQAPVGTADLPPLATFSCWGRKPLGHTWAWGQLEASCCPQALGPVASTQWQPTGGEAQACHLLP